MSTDLDDLLDSTAIPEGAGQPKPVEPGPYKIYVAFDYTAKGAKSGRDCRLMSVPFEDISNREQLGVIVKNIQESSGYTSVVLTFWKPFEF